MKRVFDLTLSLSGLVFLSPILLIVAVLIFFQDLNSPFYIASRIGRFGKPFFMIKFRSMLVDSDKNKVDSTASDDPRITKLGKLIRKTKLDEVPQLFNVIKGEMSLVGPRPNVKRETDLYTVEEKDLLSVRPGITDLSSIVFSDEGDILEGRSDPDITYNQLIRPGKSRISLFGLTNTSILLDFQIIFLTVTNSFSRSWTLDRVHNIILKFSHDIELADLAGRRVKLTPMPPPGSNQIVTSRDSI